MVDMEKKVLSETALYYGDIAMPKGFEIDRNKLQEDILNSQINNKEFSYSRAWDMLNTYMREHINVEYGFQLINKLTTGYVYKPNTVSLPKLEIDPVDLRNSPDFIMLYGVNVKDCKITFFYDDNRRKGRSWTIKLSDNKFIMFPSMQMYYITNTQKDSLNFIHTTTHESI